MTTDRAERIFSSDFKRFFLRGLVILLPSVLTLWIVVKAYQFVDNAIAEPINGWVRAGLFRLSASFAPLRDLFQPDIEQWWAHHWYLDFIGLILAIVAVYVAGRLLGGFVGRTVYRKLEKVITRVPIFKQVYPYVKQFVDFLFSDERPAKFSRVVIVEYPRKGIWSLAFITGSAMKSIAREAGDSVTLFIPSSPTPFTGYAVTVPRKETIEVPLTVEEAVRFLVTGGVLIPEHQRMDTPGLPQAGEPAPAELRHLFGARRQRPAGPHGPPGTPEPAARGPDPGA